MSSLASLGSIDDNNLAVGTLLGSLFVVSADETKNWMDMGVFTQCRHLTLPSRPIHESAFQSLALHNMHKQHRLEFTCSS